MNPKHKTPTRPLWATVTAALALFVARVLAMIGHGLSQLDKRCQNGVLHLLDTRDRLLEVRV